MRTLARCLPLVSCLALGCAHPGGAGPAAAPAAAGCAHCGGDPGAPCICGPAGHAGHDGHAAAPGCAAGGHGGDPAPAGGACDHGGGDPAAPCRCAHGAGHGGDAALLLDPVPATAAALQVTSESFAAGAPLPPAHSFQGFGCTGQNRSPALAWQGAPPATRSFAIIAHDPDAPTGVGFFHWVVANLPATTTGLPAAATLPAGAVLGRSDFGSAGYGGPCPPPGPPHRYIFTVYALDVDRLPVDGSVSGALLRFMLHEHTVAVGRLIGTFARA